MLLIPNTENEDIHWEIGIEMRNRKSHSLFLDDRAIYLLVCQIGDGIRAEYQPLEHCLWIPPVFSLSARSGSIPASHTA